MDQPQASGTTQVDSRSLEGLEAKRSALQKNLSGFEIWLLVFGLLVVVGVGGESLFGIRAWWNNRKLSSTQHQIDIISGEISASMYRDAKVALKETAEANARFKAAEVSMKEASARASEAESKAAEAKLELARFKAPRTLSQEQQQQISEAIKPFAGTTFDMYVASDSEAVALMTTIADILVGAGWKQSPATADVRFGLAGLITTSGVGIEISKDRLTELTPATNALLNGLLSAGIRTVAEANENKVRNVEYLHIMVGSKPKD